MAIWLLFNKYLLFYHSNININFFRMDTNKNMKILSDKNANIIRITPLNPFLNIMYNNLSSIYQSNYIKIRKIKTIYVII